MRSLAMRLTMLLALLLMPLGMGQAPAAAHSAPLMAMPMQHCPDQPNKHERTGALEQCTMACSAALPAADTARAYPPMIVCVPEHPRVSKALRGVLPELATPPPKGS